MTTPLVEVHAEESTWLEARKRSLGGSEIIDLLPVMVDDREPRGAWWLWVSKNPLAWESIGAEGQARYKEIEKRGFKGLDLFARHAMEPVIKRWAEETSGLTILDPGDYTILRHPEDPRAHCSPDGLVVKPFGGSVPDLIDDTDEGRFWIVRTRAEASYKTIDPFVRWRWQADQPSDYAFYQAQWTMFVTGFELDHIFAQVGLGGERNRLTYVVERHQEVIDLLREVADKLWAHVDSDTPPPADGWERTTEAIRVYFRAKAKEPSKLITLPPEGGWIATAQQIKHLEDAIDKAQREKARLEQTIEVEMGRAEANEAIIPGVDQDGRVLMESEVRYSRFSYDVKPQECDCGKQTRRGYTATRFQRRKT